MTSFCRDCLSDAQPGLSCCTVCGGLRMLEHPELDSLSIAHLDCDAFYAAIEIRDDPALRDQPVIVGGGRRGVVLTCNYVARRFGVKSAMPMFKALKLCPKAVIVRPNMDKYAQVARDIRALLREVTPLVEPVSLDEAYLDLAGTERLHNRLPAKTMAHLALHIEAKIGITVSVGLSYNKFLAKLASDLKKPRGFAIIGRAEARTFLSDKPVDMIRGVGPALAAKLREHGIERIGQIQDADLATFRHRYGDSVQWLHRLSLGLDDRPVVADGEAKSISAETTFERDLARFDALERVLWTLAERVSARAKASGLGGKTVTLKLKTAAFVIRTRRISLEHPTQLCEVIFRNGQALLRREATGTPYRLLGIGIGNLCGAKDCDPPDLLDWQAERRAKVERAMDSIRARFGRSALAKGRGLPSEEWPPEE